MLHHSPFLGFSSPQDQLDKNLEPLLSCWEQLLEVILRGECFSLEFNFLRPNTPSKKNPSEQLNEPQIKFMKGNGSMLSRPYPSLYMLLVVNLSEHNSVWFMLGTCLQIMKLAENQHFNFWKSVLEIKSWCVNKIRVHLAKLNPFSYGGQRDADRRIEINVFF